jgi:hypothetical protein
LWKREIKIEASSLKEAREKIPGGFEVIREEIISGGEPDSMVEYGDTAELAFKKALSTIPNDAEIKKKTVLVPNSEEKVFEVEALPIPTEIGLSPDDSLSKELSREFEIKRKAQARVGKNWEVTDVEIISKGKRGMFGVGNKHSLYKVKAVKSASVEVSYIQKTKVNFTIAKTSCILDDEVSQIVLDTLSDMEVSLGFEDNLAILKTYKSMGSRVLLELAQALREGRLQSLIGLFWASNIHKKEAMPILLGMLEENHEMSNKARLILEWLGSRQTEKALGDYNYDGENDAGERERKSNAIVESILDSSVENLSQSELVTKMLRLGPKIGWMGFGFALAREIGQRLYDIGGIKAMQLAYKRYGKRQFEEELKGRVWSGVPETLNYAWKDIGDWQP